jgi:ATP dependent DNA ligase domain
MLARPGPLPTHGQWAYEVKWDGFRAIVSTESELQVRSRRGWKMTELVPELSALPVFATLDGELVAFGPDRTPDFPMLCERMLMRRRGIAITYVVFDVLTLNGHNLTGTLLGAAPDPRVPKPERGLLDDVGDVRRWRRALRRGAGAGRSPAGGVVVGEPSGDRLPRLLGDGLIGCTL